MPNAVREPVRLERRAAVAKARRVEDDDVGARARTEDAAVGEAEARGGLTRQPVHGLRRSEQPLLLDHEAPEPRGPRVRTVEERLGEPPVRRERRRVRARHAEPVREGLALLVLRVRVDDHHQPVQLVDAVEQQVVDSVQRLLSALVGDRRDVATAVLRADRVVEQDDA